MSRKFTQPLFLTLLAATVCISQANACVVDDYFQLPQNALPVPLAVAENDTSSLYGIATYTNPSHGRVSLSNGNLSYTPDNNYSGADEFTYTVTKSDGQDCTATVNVDIQASHRQSQHSLNSEISASLRPSGRFLVLEKYAQLPRDENNRVAKANSMATYGGRTWVVVSGSVDGEGLIYELVSDANNQISAKLFLDVGKAVNDATGRELDNGGQQGGVRSLAIHPDFNTNGKFYTSLLEERPSNLTAHTYISDENRPYPRDGMVVEWTYVHATEKVDPNSYREVFRIGTAERDHPIKAIAFNQYAIQGDTGYGLLYISHGDGSVEGSGQNNDALGKVLRVNPLQSGALPYTIPASNPYTNDNSYPDEVYAIGFRNPHNLTFAKQGNNSALLLTDIGRHNFDEINLVEIGENYGWPEREGPMQHFVDIQPPEDSIAPLQSNEANRQYVFPATFIGHTQEGDAKLALAGAHVINNGSTDLNGQFIFGDFSTDGRVYHADWNLLNEQTTKLNSSSTANDAPDELSWVTPSELTILFDHDNNDQTLPLVRQSVIDVLDDDDSFQEVLVNGKARGDIRFGQGANGELFILNKRNDWIYLVENTLPNAPPWTPTPNSVTLRVTEESPNSPEALVQQTATTQYIINGSFESPDVPNGDNENFRTATISGWQSNNLVIWDGPLDNFDAIDGDQFAELNRGSAKHIFQDVESVPGQTLEITFQHRGRDGTDTLELRAGAPGATVSIATFSATTSWTSQSTSYQVPNGQNSTRIELLSNMSSNKGNLIDNVRVQAGSIEPPENQIPTAIASANPINGTAPLHVSFDATSSTDPDSDNLSFAWDFINDGSVDATVGTTSHTYQQSGTYTASVTVDDGNGGSDRFSLLITVEADGGGEPGTVGTELVINGGFESPNVPDGDNDNFKTSTLDGWNTKKLIIWDGPLDDFDAPSGAQFAELNRGSAKRIYQDVVTNPGQNLDISFLHRARSDTDSLQVHISAPGQTVEIFSFSAGTVWTQQSMSYIVPPDQATTRIQWVSLMDANQGNLIDEISVISNTVSSPTNQNPVANATADTTAGDAPLAVNFNASTSSDLDGDSLTYSWDFTTDGTTDSNTAVTSHLYTQAGSHLATLTVIDGNGGTDSASVAILVEPVPPIGQPVNFLNGGFESPNVLDEDNENFKTGTIPGWSSDKIILWNGPLDDFDAIEGIQFAELNRGSAKRIYQDFATVPGQNLNIAFQQRAESATDSLQIFAGAPGSTASLGTFSASISWTQQQLTYVVPAGQNTTRLEWVSTMTSNKGNYLDAVVVEASGTPPTDNLPPSAFASGLPLTGTAPLQVNFDGSASSDPDGDVLSFDWDFNNDGNSDANSSSAAYQYNFAGVYTATLTVDDGNGGSDTHSLAINITSTPNNAIPTIIATATPTAGEAPLQVFFNADNSTDPDGDTLNFAWDFSSDASIDTIGSATSHTYITEGSYVATLLVEDSNGGSATMTLPITVTAPQFNNQAPTANALASPVSGTVPLEVSFDATSSSDPDGDSLSYAWDFTNDSSTDATGETSSTTYTEPGTYTVSLLVSDGNGGSDLWTQAIETIDITGTEQLVNGGFELPDVSDGDNENFNTNSLIAWSSDILIIWDGPLDGFDAFEGQQFAELNRGSAKRVFQDFSTQPGDTLDITFRQRGREGTDTLELKIGAPGSTTQHATFSAPTQWTAQNASYSVPAGQFTTRVEWVSNMSSNRGNLLDAVSVLATPVIITPNLPPTAIATRTPSSGTEPFVINFDATASSDPENQPLTYSWDFDSDGDEDSTSPTPSHTYYSEGINTALLTVTDERNASHRTSVQTTVVRNYPSSLDRQRDAALYEIILALQAYGAANADYAVNGGGFQGTGQGWFHQSGTVDYPVSISDVLINHEFLGSPIPKDPLLNTIGVNNIFDFMLYNCADRVAVFAMTDALETSRSDAEWWANNDCLNEAIDDHNHQYFRLSAPLADAGNSNIPVFSGAQGYGTQTSAGKNGALCTVSNLQDSGPGSLRECIELNAPRTIVFNVSGTITLDSTLDIENPFVSVLGDTAPGGGIALRTTTDVAGPVLRVSSHDVLVQYLRIRASASDLDNVTCCRDAVSIGSPVLGRVYNVVLDHNSISWGTDEVVEIWYDSHDITLSNNIIAEGLFAANNSDGPAGRGLLVGSNTHSISIHHNLFAHNYQRNPSIYNSGTNDLVNNIVYHWVSRGFQISSRRDALNVNLVKNLLISNTNQPHPTNVQWYDIEIDKTTSNPISVYFEGNIGHWRTYDSEPQWSLAATDFLEPYDPQLELHTYTRHNSPPVSEYDASELEDILLPDVGASLPARDSADLRVIQEVKSRSGFRRDCVTGCSNHAGGWPVIQ